MILAGTISLQCLVVVLVVVIVAVLLLPLLVVLQPQPLPARGSLTPVLCTTAIIMSSTATSMVFRTFTRTTLMFMAA
jgi:hypothetical protein